MAHFVYQLPSGDWSAVTTPDPVWFTGFDQQLFKALNADDGGTWAPTNPIVIGGSGINISGPLLADNVQLLEMTGQLLIDGASTASILVTGPAAFIQVESGADIKLFTGAGIELHSSNMTVDSASTVTIDPSLNIQFSSSRTVTRTGLRLRGCTVGGGNPNTGATASTDPDAYVSSTIIVTKRLTAVGTSSFLLDIPWVIDGATITQITIKSVGLYPAAGQPANYPTYLPRRSGVSMRSAGAKTDQHSVSLTWFADVQTTTISCDQNNVIDKSTHVYDILCAPPADGGGAQVWIEEVKATYTVPYIGPAQ